MDLVSSDRVPLFLTLVSHIEGDLVGKALAYVSLAPLFFAVLEIAFVLAAPKSAAKQRVAVMLLTGQLLNEAFNALLKGHLQESRPSGTERLDYGMPSSHAQFMGYLAAVAPYFFEFTVFHRLPRLFTKAIFPVASWAVGFSRIYLGYHDLRQVAVGFFIGLAFGLLWADVLRVLSRESGTTKKA